MDERGTPPARALPWVGTPAVDAVVAVVYTAILVGSPAPDGTSAWFRFVVAALAGLPLAVRRRRPVAVLVVVSVASIIGLATGVTSDPLLGVAFAVYPVATALPDLPREPTRALAGLAVVVVAGTALVGTDVPSNLADDLRQGLLAVVVISGSWALGRVVRERRRQADAAWREAADRLVLEERVRLARDLHDLVSGSLSMIGVRAAVALHLADEHPDQLREALQVIDTAAAEGLTEMRRMLAVLRGEDAPVPSLRDVIVTEARRAQAGGVDLTVDVDDLPDAPDDVLAALGQAVREAVTNLLRHAAPTTATLGLRVDDGWIDLHVTDDGPAAPRPHAASPAAASAGLRGMHERVTRLGGTTTAGPRGRGWQVLVRLPAERTLHGSEGPR